MILQNKSLRSVGTLNGGGKGRGLASVLAYDTPTVWCGEQLLMLAEVSHFTLHYYLEAVFHSFGSTVCSSQ